MERALVPVVLVAAVAVAGCTESTPYGSKIDDRAHPFALTTIDGEDVTLEGLTSDGILVLDLMGVNCGPCRQQTRQLVKWHDEYNTSGIRMLSVDLGGQIGALGADDEQEIVEFRDEFGAQWDFAADTDGVGQDYEVIGFPTLYVIDREGVIVFKETSVKTAEDFDATIRPFTE